MKKIFIFFIFGALVTACGDNTDNFFSDDKTGDNQDVDRQSAEVLVLKLNHEVTLPKLSQGFVFKGSMGSECQFDTLLNLEEVYLSNELVLELKPYLLELMGDYDERLSVKFKSQSANIKAVSCVLDTDTVEQMGLLSALQALFTNPRQIKLMERKRPTVLFEEHNFTFKNHELGQFVKSATVENDWYGKCKFIFKKASERMAKIPKSVKVFADSLKPAIVRGVGGHVVIYKYEAQLKSRSLNKLSCELKIDHRNKANEALKSILINNQAIVKPWY